MKRSSDDGRGPKEIPFPISLLFLPLFFVAGLLSIPVGAVMVVYFRHKERRFAQQMRSQVA